jgi:hypothetical protein
MVIQITLITNARNKERCNGAMENGYGIKQFADFADLTRMA